jgi:drug/metabolite transporter (DMT)-like permease
MFFVRQISMRKEPFPSLKLIIEMFLIGTLGITTVSFTYFLAIETIDTGLAIVMWYFFPVIVVLITWFVFKKPPSRNIMISLFFSLTGIIITTGQVKGGSNSAIALVMVSSFLFAFYLLAVNRTLAKVDLLTGVTFINIGAAIGYWLICATLPFGLTVDFPANQSSWFYISTFALFGTVAPFMFSYAGLKRVGPSMLSVITTIEPVLAIAMGVIFLNEAITLARIVGAIFVVGALIALSMLESRDESTAVNR